MLRSLLALLLIAAPSTTPTAVTVVAGPSGYRVQGTAVAGTSGVAGAPRLVPGQYVDTLTDGGDDGTTRFYALTLRGGDTPYVVATMVRPGAASGDLFQVKVELGVIEDGRFGSCDFTEQQSLDSLDGRYDAATAVLTPGVVAGPDWPDACPPGGSFALAVTRSGDAYAGTAARVELGVRIEPSADAGAAPGPATRLENVKPVPGSTLQAVRGGADYTDALALARGTYRDTVTAGQTRYYRVRLAWGQRLAFVLVADSSTDISGGVVLTNPLRQPLGLASPNQETLGLGSLYGSSAVPVRWTNRDSDDSDVVPYSIEGDYYLLISTKVPDAGTTPAVVGYTLQIQVVGSRERGPVYAPGTADATGVPQAAESGSSGTWIVAVIAGAVALLVVLAVVLLVRRRRVSPRAATRTFRT